MKNVLLSMLALALFSIPLHSSAKNRTFYTVVSAGYATNDVQDETFDDLTYKANIGYVLGDQWALEFGFHGLGDAGLSNEDLINNTSGAGASNYTVNAIVLSALGKAGNEHGELFYRLGAVYLNSESTFLVASDTCAGDESLLASQTDSVLCGGDENQFAGVIGLGFDFYISRSLLLRTEFEYIQGTDDYSAQSVLLGLRYNF
jgi:opacity protein-like surface antigen